MARPLIEGLSTPTVVSDPIGAAMFDVRPAGFDEALDKAIHDER